MSDMPPGKQNPPLVTTTQEGRTVTAPDELAAARQRRRTRTHPETDPAAYFAAIETKVRQFVELHRQGVAVHGRIHELFGTVELLTQPGTRPADTHLAALASMLAVAVDILTNQTATTNTHSDVDSRRTGKRQND